MLSPAFFTHLASNHRLHARQSDYYRRLDEQIRPAFHSARPAFEQAEPVELAEFGPVTLPYLKMGAIDSIDLFGLDELIMFSYYMRNRGRYRRAADIGANLGLHSILLAKCGVHVDAYEPDPKHFEKLQHNLHLNGVAEACTPHMCAVSDRAGMTKFVRVLGNTTSSHILGAKPNPYGDLEYFDVTLEDVRDIAKIADFMKIDAEGHEAVILKALPIAAWERTDAFVEIGSTENANKVFEHFAGTPVNLYSQKYGWGRVEHIGQMPDSYKEGGIFVSAKPHMTW